MLNRLPDDQAPLRFPTQRELLTAIIRRWFIVILCAGIGVAYGISIVRSTPYRYTVQMTVTPAQRSQTNSGGSGLAALVNLALPGGENGSDFGLYLDLLKSRNIADELVKDQQLMHALYAGDWDAAAQKWREPPPDTRSWPVAEKRLLDYLGYPPVQWRAPDGETMLGFLQNVAIEQDPRKPYMAKLVMIFDNKEFAMQFLEKVHMTADSMLRERAIKRTTDYIAYLSSTLAKVTVAEHRLALVQALSEQEKAAMVAKSGAPFAAEVLEEPWAASYPSFPQVFQTLARWGFIGTLAGCVLALLLWRATTSWKARSVRRAAREPMTAPAQAAADAKAA
jgi:hypothetical protein